MQTTLRVKDLPKVRIRGGLSGVRTLDPLDVGDEPTTELPRTKRLG